MIHVLIYRDEFSEYLFDQLKNVDVIFLPVRKHSSLKDRFIKAMYYNLTDIVYSSFFDKDIVSRLKKIPQDDCLIVFGEDTYSYWVLSKICSHIKNKVAYFWNPCSSLKGQKVCLKIKHSPNKIKAIVDYIRNLGFKMSTFDSGDAKKYNMFFFPQFYRNSDKFFDINNNFSTDFFFCGRDKGRKDILKSYEKKLSAFGVCNFIVIDSQCKDYMGYYDYLNELKKTSVLCEVVQTGQTGVTVRSVEALFHRKKLITNNEAILNYDFYRPENILLYNENLSEEQIQTFLSTPYYEVEKKIIDSYSVETLLKKLAYMQKGAL